MTDNLLDSDDFQLLDVIEYFEFLDELRESGETNMFGAAPYLERNFPELDIKEARIVLGAWTKTFDGTGSPEDRAYKALGETS